MTSETATIDDNQMDVDVLDRINAMRSQEEKTKGCHNYFTSIVDESCRKAIVDWCFIVADSFDLSRETVGIAMSILDRYLSSNGKGKSAEALQSKQTFQLVAITSFYMAVKINEPVQLGIEMLVKLCRGFYTGSTIAATEQDILYSLKWRVCISTTTPMEYVRHFLELLPGSMHVSHVILENAMKHMDCATSDIIFSTCRASTVGIVCLAGAINDTLEISPSEKELLWAQLSSKLDFDVASNEVRKVERQLLAKSTCHEPRSQSRTSLPRPGVNSANKQPLSPGSVMQVW
mmetsp:Transcript_21803/g.47465  ORF Transcript_21803/g.47465 Transcript_21803/m.47465 type:complete len:290 (+) Transcript_21803:87-956(+)